MSNCPNSEGATNEGKFSALDRVFPRASGAGGVSESPLPPPAEWQLFQQQIKSNESFFQLLLSLINASCPMPSVELLWTEAASADQTDGHSFRASQTLPGPWSLGSDPERTSPRPFFEDLTRRAPAQLADVCMGAPYVEQSKYGMVYLAVPVEAGGYHIATIVTGQALTSPPTEVQLAQIANDAAAMDWVDIELLQQAYREAPVVRREDLRRTGEMLEVVAGFLAKALAQMIEAAKEQRRKGRELRLARQEFAYLALDWSESGRGGIGAEEIVAIQRRIGFHRSPNRILVVRPEAETGSRRPYPFSPLEAVERMCDKLDDVAATRVEASSICVYLHDGGSSGNSSQKMEARRLAGRILHEIQENCDLSARIGIGRPKENWRGLAESYREACLALAGTGQPIAFYQEPCGSLDDLTLSVEDLCRSLGENRLEEAGLAVAALPELVSRHLGARTEDFAFARLFFSFVMESMSLTAQKLGCSGTDVAALCADAVEEFKRAASFLQLQATWLRSANELVERTRRLNTGKRQKIIESACRTIQSGIEHGSSAHELSISAVAAGLRVSVSHMSRTFKQQTGQTFEQYVIAKRVDFAKRLLRDPLFNVSEVAVRSGFSDPSYFARVFRKAVGCSPREYCANPQDSGWHRTRQAGVERWPKPSRSEPPGTAQSASLGEETPVSADAANTSAA